MKIQCVNIKVQKIVYQNVLSNDMPHFKGVQLWHVFYWTELNFDFQFDVT